MSEFKRVFSLVLIMMTVAAIAVASALYILYQTALNEERARLMETAQSQARLIEAVARFDAVYSQDYPRGAKEATLSQIIDAHENYTGFGKTGEFTLAERRGDQMVFILSHRHFDTDKPKPVPFDSELAEPMRRALSGQSGTVIGLDYRGGTVLAAHEPVNELDLGIVAKIDLAEIRAPFVKAAVAAGCCTLFVVLVGSGLFFYISNPMIRRLRDNAEELQRANEQLESEIAERKKNEERIRYLNSVLRAIRNVNQLITKERDKNRLLQGACDNLIESLGYQNAWIAVKDASEEFTSWAHAGFDGAFRNMEEKLRRGELTRCGERAMAQSDVVIVGNPESECLDCPLKESYSGKGALVIRLEHEDSVYGLMAVSVLKRFLEDSQQLSLLRELAGDIAFALYKLELEEDRKKAEEELCRYEHIVSSSNDFLALLDKEYRYQAVNDEFLSAFGLSREEMIGRSVGQIFGETVFHESIKPYADRCLAGEPVRYEGCFEFPARGKRSMDMEYFPYYESEESVGGFVVSARDITEAKKLEQRLIQSQKMEAIGALAGGIAHDFNNILSAIIGFTELALDDAPEGTPQRENLQDVLTAGRRAKALVSQILTFSRQRDEEQKPVPVLPVLKEALKLLRPALPSTIEIREHFQVGEGEDSILSNPTQIQQIVMNLCTNAADAIEEEGGILEVRLETVSLDPETARQYIDVSPGEYLRLTVTDTGKGMEPGTVQRIFEPYFTTKANGKGTGMGLSVVHGIVKAHGGTTTVYSEPGEGTTVNIYIPQGSGNVVSESEGVKELPTGNEHILFVDDEPALVKLNQQMLGSLGYTVETETNGVEALARFRSNPDAFDLVITDMTMPQMTGETLAKELLRIRPDIPIILCTGYTQRISAEKCRQIGIKEFLLKPVGKVNLSKVVRQVLERK